MLSIGDVVQARSSGIKDGKETSKKLNTDISSPAMVARMSKLREAESGIQQTVAEVVSRLSRNPVLHLSDIKSTGAALSLDAQVQDEVYAWGWGDSGCLSTGHFDMKLEPWLIPRMPNKQSVLQIACGARHTLFLTTDTLGDNFAGQLGVNMGHIKVSSPIEVDLTSTVGFKHAITGKVFHRPVYIATSAHSSLCVTEKGAVCGWGENRHGEIGNGETYRYLNKEGTEVRRPPSMPCWTIGTGDGYGEHFVTEIACGDFFCVALTRKGKVLAWGLGKDGRLGQAGRLRALREGGETDAEIAEREAATLREEIVSEILPKLLAERVSDLRRRLASRGLDRTGKKNEIAERLAQAIAKQTVDVDQNSTSSSEKPRPVTVTAQPHSAGHNTTKVRGVGTRRRKTQDDDSFWQPVEIPFSGKVHSIYAGLNFAGALADLEIEEVKLDDTGKPVINQLSGEEVLQKVIRVVPWTWGCSKKGQLGHGDYKDGLEPRPIELLSTRGVTVLALGGETCVAYAAKESKIYAWGAGLHAQLGHCDQWCKAKPYEIRTIRGHHVNNIAIGRRHCILSTQIGLYSWGFGLDGQLGHGNIKSRVIPYEIILNKTWQFTHLNVAGLWAGQSSTFASVFKLPGTFVRDGTFMNGEISSSAYTNSLDAFEWISKWIHRRKITREQLYNLMDVSASATLCFKGFYEGLKFIGIRDLKENMARYLYKTFSLTRGNRSRWTEVESFLFPELYPEVVAKRKAEHESRQTSSRKSTGGFRRNKKRSTQTKWSKSNPSNNTGKGRKSPSNNRKIDLLLPPPKTHIPDAPACEQRDWVRKELERRGETALTLRRISETSKSYDISYQELYIGLNRIGIRCSMGTVKRMFNQMHKQLKSFADNPAAAKVRKPRVLSDEELEEARYIFNQYDVDKSGSIDNFELHRALNAVGMELSMMQVETIIDAIDVDGDECVDFEEFTWMLAQVPAIEGGIHHRIPFEDVNKAFRKRNKRELEAEKKAKLKIEKEKKKKLKEKWAAQQREMLGEEDMDQHMDEDTMRETNDAILGAILE